MVGRLGLLVFSPLESYRIPCFSLHPFPSPVISLSYLSYSYLDTYKPYSSTLSRPHIPASTVHSCLTPRFEEQVHAHAESMCSERKNDEESRAMKKTLCHCPVCSWLQTDCRPVKVSKFILKNKDFVMVLSEVWRP